MATTPLMNLPVPGPRQVPFLDTMDAFFAAVDAWLQAMREDALTIAGPGFDGSPWVVDTKRDTVAWEDIVLGSGDGLGQIQIPRGSIAIPSMSFLCAVIPSRPITGVVVPALQVLASIPRDPDVIPLGVRLGPVFVPLRQGYGGLEQQVGCVLQAMERQRDEFDGGDFISGDWVTRAISEATFDRGGPKIMQGPLPAILLGEGVYRIIGSAPAFRVGKHMTRIVDIGTGFSLLNGTTEFAAFEDSESEEIPVQTRSHVNGYVVGPATIVLQHRCQVTRLVNGLGIGNAGAGGAFGCEESFATLQVEYLGADRKIPKPPPEE